MNGFEQASTEVLVTIHGKLAKSIEAFVAMSHEDQFRPRGKGGISEADVVANIRLPLLQQIESVLKARGGQV